MTATLETLWRDQSLNLGTEEMGQWKEEIRCEMNPYALK